MSTTPEWYLARDGKQEGPFTEAAVVSRIRAGQADGATYVYGPGVADWVPLSSVPALATHLAPPAAAAPAPRAAAAPAATAAAPAVAAAPAAARAPSRPAAAAAEGEPSHTLAQFIQETGEKDRPGDVFELESKSMLEVHVNGRTWAKLGSMVAYRGQLKFVREGALEGGLGKFMTKMVSGEQAPLVKIEGQGLAYLADQKKNVTILRLQPHDAINVNGNDLLAFEETVVHQITMHRRIAGMLAGGLFSVRLNGPGMIAIMTHGDPLTLRVSPGDPVITDPNATVAWSANLAPDFKTDISFRSFLGRGGGEAFQMQFVGEGFVVVQPYEELPVATGQGAH
jgi:uncharacterized protein (AIM24 family)